MEKMKKVLFLLMVGIVAAALAACGGDKKADDKPAAPAGEEAGTDSGTADEPVAEDVDPVDPNFDKIIDLLKKAGLEVGEKKTGFADIEGTQQVMEVEIDGEDMLPLQIYKMDPDSENLKSAKEEGKVTMTFEGESGEIPMNAKGDFLYFIADGHPDRDKVYEVIENDFEQE
ncbi:hypothetical protein NCCP2716_06950 [Sporosarcina sp. NCCP-2716]|uniref:hypothetical protein n=1 Tax=Sporosarcina sp. NCCP-2716 TaxID=2943679 RepID=UPI002040F87A|nr:hypothetical protein [Sporosarcina sp. NCCP-2716]GKV68197.1 hypothetical protein NCCP2716_06950 [Sporosarcina sp. NCCP-2716]